MDSTPTDRLEIHVGHRARDMKQSRGCRTLIAALLLGLSADPALIHAQQINGGIAGQALNAPSHVTGSLGDASVLKYQAHLAAMDGKVPEAIADATQALAIYDKYHVQSEYGTVDVLNLLGTLYLQQQRIIEANEAFSRLIALCRKWQPTGPLQFPAALEAANQLNQYYYNVGQYADAERWGQMALDGDPGSITLAANLVMAKLAQPDRIGSALEMTKAMLSQVDEAAAQLKDDPRDERVKESRESDRLQAVLLYTDAAWSTSQADPQSAAALRLDVFRRLQEVTGGPAAQSVAESAARRYANDAGGAKLLKQRDALRAQWLATVKDYEKASSRIPYNDFGREQVELANKFHSQISSTLKQIGEVSSQIEARAPRYFAIVHQPALSLADAQALLDEQEAVLWLVPSVLGTQIMVLTKGTLTWHRSSLKRDHINAMVARLRQDLDPTTTGNGLPTFDRKTAHQLYAELIAPISDAIANKTYLFVTASESLASLPIGVLVTKAPEAGEDESLPDVLGNTPWFADEHALIQLPSLQSLAFIRTYAQRVNAPEKIGVFAGYGDPILGGSPAYRGTTNASATFVDANNLVGQSGEGATPLMNPDALRSLRPLPGTNRELTDLKKEFTDKDSLLRLREDMTERAIKADARARRLAGIAVLDIATHGLTVGQSGALAEPGLVFTPPAKATAEDDGYLSASEVLGLDLTGVEWVILSACNSAAPASSTPQTSLSGLASAFLYAGATDLLVSHWPVDDAVAAKLSKATVKAAKGGQTKAQALQAAMQAIRKGGDVHPKFWAPFALVGER